MNTLPPIAIEAQKRGTEGFMICAIRYGTSIYREYNELPILLVISGDPASIQKAQQYIDDGYEYRRRTLKLYFDGLRTL